MMIPIFMQAVYNKTPMKRILFLFLCSISWLQPPAWGAIEIYVKGHKYASIMDYLASKKSVFLKSPTVTASLNRQQEQYVLQKAKEWGVKVDFKKVKTIQIGPKNLSNSTQHKLYVLSIENGVISALKDFYETQGLPNLGHSRPISSEQLQDAINQAVARSKEPKLLISTPGKVRIMSMSSK